MEREIGQPTTYKEACELIENFIDDHKFKSFYTIIQRESDTPYVKVDNTKNRYVFDVGSHTEFFILDTCGEEIDEFKGL
jgi:hypothetical protein